MIGLYLGLACNILAFGSVSGDDLTTIGGDPITTIGGDPITVT